jgi:hypothetical protein
LVANGLKIPITTIATTVVSTLRRIALRRRRTHPERRLARAKAFSRSAGAAIAIWRSPTPKAPLFVLLRPPCLNRHSLDSLMAARLRP